MAENLVRISVRVSDEHLVFLKEQAAAKIQSGLKSDVSDQVRTAVTRLQLSTLEPWQLDVVYRRLELGVEKGGDPERDPEVQLDL